HHLYKVWRCSGCSSLYAADDVDLELIYKDYPLAKQKRDLILTRGFKKRLQFLKDNGLTKSHKVLDYGCGSGYFSDFLNNEGFAAWGYDPYVPEFNNRRALNEKYDFVLSQDV